MLGRTSAICLVIAWLIASVLLSAQGITYVYDKAGRLIAVVNGSGESAVYTCRTCQNVCRFMTRK